MLRLRALLIFGALFNSIESFSQSRYQEFGAFAMYGSSVGINGQNSPLNNQITEYVNGFVQVGAFGYFGIRRDTLNRLIKYLRIDLGIASRTGTFDLWNGGIARMTSNSVDLTPMVPIRTPVLKGIDGYMSFGPVFSYRLMRSIVANQTPPPEATTGTGFKMGFAFEIGFRIGYSFISYRLSREFNDYPYKADAINFGINIPDRWKKRKR